MRLSAVVVHFRTPDLLLRHLPSLKDFDEVFVVDNGSGDDSPRHVRDRCPWVTVVEAGANRGFGAGANLGLQAATGDAVLLLNPDSVAAPDLRARMVDALTSHPKLWVAGCRLTDEGGRPRENGRRWYTPVSVALRRLAPESGPAQAHVLGGWRRDHDRPIDWVSGNGMVIRREAIARLGGGFDERYFMYFEDVDLCLRVWREGGEVWFLAGPEVTHLEQRASARGLNRALWWHLRSYARFVRKWGRVGLHPPPYGDRANRQRLA